ncbi:MAG: preprotein translocase subunit SecA, partial [Proteobacteria bacterium]|nr:preprotein translocase subunit SecA [Pseudomonadota bacterium]
MIGFVAKKIFGTRNERVIRSFNSTIKRINELEGSMRALSDGALQQQTVLFRQRLAQGEALDSLIPEAFATVREASRRVLNMRHFDVQLLGGLVLHSGRIAEMKTGEGKTLVATLPSYLNALTGKGVHVVTVNDYLARRDAEWMGRIHSFLGLSVGCIFAGMREDTKRAAYKADITYGQNNEFGFDYLRDNMRFDVDEMYQRGHNFAIVDEVDSILIDEARTPLIISGPAEESTERYTEINRIIPYLKKELHFDIEAKTKQPSLTEEGTRRVEELLQVENLFDPNNIETLHHVNQALRAYTTLERDVDYVVKDGEVIIVDEFTGRLMPGRRWSNGLHQAVEAKEGLQVARENQTLASVTFQNYFRMYSKLSGMTGTADTEAVEFKQIYSLEVIVIPPNRPMVRKDDGDVVYRSRKEKYDAVCQQIAEVHNTGQPVLVGTISIEQSEFLARHLQKLSIPHNVLNAKQHEREAEIVAQAGRFGAVTISTNMAGRGTDILLGGNPEFLAAAETKTKDPQNPEFRAAVEKYRGICDEEKRKVIEAGGLFIIGTERHESRRIDNQLRGRAGRQGDPGRSQFYISLEDELMLRFGGEWMQGLMQRVGWEEGVALDGRLISRSIETAQKRVEAFHF